MKYFIHAVGYGPGSLETEFNTEIDREQPICSIQDIHEIERALARPCQGRVVIRNWQRFEYEVMSREEIKALLEEEVKAGIERARSSCFEEVEYIPPARSDYEKSEVYAKVDWSKVKPSEDDLLNTEYELWAIANDEQS